MTFLLTALNLCALKAVPGHNPTEQVKVVRAGAYIWRIGDTVSGNERWLHEPEEPLRDDANLLKRPVNRSASRVVRMIAPKGNLVFKAYGGGIREMFKAMFRGPRALRAFNFFFRLQELGIPALRPIAAGYQRCKPWKSILVTEEVPNGRAPLPFVRAAPNARRSVIGSVATIMGQMHAAGLYHGDAHQANFLVREGDKANVCLVDVDGVRQPFRITPEMAAHSLSRLLDYSSPSRREILYFVAMYCRASKGMFESREFVTKCERDLALHPEQSLPQIARS